MKDKEIFLTKYLPIIILSIVLLVGLVYLIINSTRTKESRFTETTKTTYVVDKNLDSTCLAFYSKLKALDYTPARPTVKYTAEELKAIQQAYQGEYNPVLDDVHTKQAEAQRQYMSSMQNRITERQSLSKNYQFCYEYLAKTYGYIIGN